jgi:hypothetical protein
VRLKPLGHLSALEHNLLTLAEIDSIRMASPGCYLQAAPRKTQMLARITILPAAASQVD